MRPHYLKSISQRPLWQASGPLSGSLQVAFLLTLTIPLIASLPAICLLDVIRRKGQASESTQEKSAE